MFEAERLRPLFAGRLSHRSRKTAAQSSPVSPDLKGWWCDHHTSVDMPEPRLPSASTAVGNSSALGGVTTFSRSALLRALRPEDRELRRVENAADDLGIRLFQVGDLDEKSSDSGGINAEVVDLKALEVNSPGRPCCLSSAATPSGSFVNIVPTTLLVSGERLPHVGEDISRPCRSPREMVSPLEALLRIALRGGRTRPATDRPR